MRPKFTAGKNIAMKVPAHEFDKTVSFYRDVLGFEEIDESACNIDTVTFKFGDKNLWIDKIDSISQAELWLEVVVEDLDAASNYFKQQGCKRRDEIERLPDDFKGFWISNPSNIIHLVTQ